MSPVGLAFLRERKAAKEFNALDRSFRRLVFYSEGSADWPHLGPVIETLLRDHDQKISYLTSDPMDPGLSVTDVRFRAFQIGTGTVRTILFRKMECDHFVMTLPDLGELWLKRSVHPVHYVYLFHSINSTHTSYRKGAFDNYDTILCVGPHHVDEIRRTEAHYGLRAKELIEHGSIKLDSVLARFRDRAEPSIAGTPPEVLVAPSWGNGSLIEMPVGAELIDVLIRSGYRTTLRLHPMTVRRLPRLAPEFVANYHDQPLFRVEEDMNAAESWMRSAVMISDWSGAATEYAFALQKPVIYIDTPPKIRNPEWRTIGTPAFESSIREEIGQVVQQSEIGGVPERIEDARRAGPALGDQISAARSKSLFNVGRGSQVAAEYLAALK